jgi:hypothetical protein
MTLHLTRDRLMKLAKVCSLLGSSHDGEALSAARRADEIVRRAGVSWNEVLAPSYRALPTSSAPPMSVAEKLALCSRYSSLFNPWERKFIRDLHHYRHPTPKQLALLVRLAEKIAEERTPHDADLK